MDIGNALRRAWKDDIIMRSMIANTITELYGKNIAIQSVKILWKKIIIKTGNSLINSELQLLEWDIKEKCIEKLWKLWIKIHSESVMRFT